MFLGASFSESACESRRAQETLVRDSRQRGATPKSLPKWSASPACWPDLQGRGEDDRSGNITPWFSRNVHDEAMLDGQYYGMGEVGSVALEPSWPRCWRLREHADTMAMIRIAITPAAFEAILATLPFGSMDVEREPRRHARAGRELQRRHPAACRARGGREAPPISPSVCGG